MRSAAATSSSRRSRVVNAAGDVLDWRTGRIVAGARTADGPAFANSAELLRRDLERPRRGASLDDQPFRATTLTVIATNVALDKTSLTKLAMMANTGAARAINPYHTQGDGDQVLAISTNRLKRDVSLTALGSDRRGSRRRRHPAWRRAGHGRRRLARRPRPVEIARGACPRKV